MARVIMGTVPNLNYPITNPNCDSVHFKLRFLVLNFPTDTLQQPDVVRVFGLLSNQLH